MYQIQFSNDGSKLFCVDYTNNNIDQFDLSSPWDMTSATYFTQYSVSGQSTSATTFLAFNADGSKMYAGGTTTDTIYEYDLPTSFVLTGASYSGNSYAITANPYNIQTTYDANYVYFYHSTGSVWYQHRIPGTFLYTFEFEAQSSAPLTLSVKEKSESVSYPDAIDNYTEPITVNYSEAAGRGRYLKFGISSPKNMNITQVKFDLWKEV